MTNPKSIFLLAVLMIAAGAGWWIHTRAQTSGMPQRAGGSSAAAGGPMVAVKLPESLTAAAQEGKVLFERACAACHGENAAGSGKGPPLVHKIYEPNHHGDQAFQLAARNGVRAHHWKFGNMPALPDVSEVDVTAIVTYVRELQRANGIN
jgi:mono/diheme cytochrome c family protein